jgi:ubiquinone/menaquinone biosynthesis C-methylase UbiE
LLNLLLKKYSYSKLKKIFGNNKESIFQKKEFTLRKNIAKKKYNNFLKEISMHHSFNVMDRKVEKFIRLLPKNSIICDLGGSWGWHWRNIDKQRPDIKIVIIDFVCENLIIAKKILKNKINKQIFLVNDDCCKFKIRNNFFDAFWSVQTLQHIPNYILVYKKVYNQLKIGGYFCNCNLNKSYLIKIIYWILNKDYLEKGYNKNYYLERSNNTQKIHLEKIFKNKANTIYSELFFHPDINLYTGKKSNLLGKIDSFLTGSCLIKKIFARQETYLIIKK